MKKKIFFAIFAMLLCAPLPSWARLCCMDKTGNTNACQAKTSADCFATTKQIYCETDNHCYSITPDTCVFGPPGGTSGSGAATTPAAPCDATTSSCPSAGAAPAGDKCAETSGPSQNCSTVDPPAPGYVLIQTYPKTSQELVSVCNPAPTAPATATTQSAPPIVPFEAINPTLMIPIPTLDMTKMVATQAPNGDVTLPYLALYITAFYKFGVAAAAVLAVIMIMVGGFRWLISAGNTAQIGEAKKMITSALIGLILAFGSYTALQVINPQLTSLNPIVIKSVLTNGLTLPSGDVGSDTDTSACADVSTLVSITGLPNITAAAPDNRLTSDSAGALSQAGAIAVKTPDPGNPPTVPPSGGNFSGLKVFSAYRSQAYQQQLFAQAVTQYGSTDAAAKHVATGATCQGAHLTGHAVDIHLMLNGNELGKGSMSFDRINALESIMNQAGWVRYCPEWWHFEFNLPLGTKRAKPCDRPYGSGNSAF